MEPVTPFAPDLLAGRAALVTGGGSGIGFGIADCLSRCGAAVAIVSRSRERLEEAAERLLAASPEARVLPLPADVRDPEALTRAVDAAASELGGLDALVNNAAGNFHAPSERLSPNGFRAVVETDLHGTFFASQAAFPHLRARGGGSIVNISMTLHYRGWALMAHATAAKAGVDALTRTLALEWGGHGIRVNAVAPGPVPTEGVLRAFASPSKGSAAEDGGRDAGEDGGGAGNVAGGATAGSAERRSEGVGPFGGPRAVEAYARRFIPAGRLGRPEDIGWMVTYLCSPAASFVTGAIFVVDGGESLASPRALGAAPE